MRTNRYWLALTGALIATVSVLIWQNHGLQSTKSYFSERASRLEQVVRFKEVEDRLQAQVADQTCVASNELLKIRQKIENMRPSVNERVLTQLSISVQRYSQEYRVDPDMLIAIAFEESNFEPRAVSSAGAMGIMQVMPLWVDGLDFIHTRDDLLDIDQNVRAGAHIYREYLNLYRGNAQKALLAYNRGPGSILDSIEKGENPDNGYPSMVLASYNRIRKF